MEWIWDERKALANYRKHGIRFEIAVQVFEDEFHLTEADPHPDDNRWQTIGVVGMATLFVVHAEIDDAGTGQIISALRATPPERRVYETLHF